VKGSDKGMKGIIKKKKLVQRHCYFPEDTTYEVLFGEMISTNY
jgi:hypothetical protein